ncbi:hypothetical protein KIPB_012335, partial [Kipferlia bialata]
VAMHLSTVAAEEVRETEITPAMAAKLVGLRMSTRNFKADVPAANVLTDIVSLASCAPSGAGCDPCRYTVVSGPDAMAPLVDNDPIAKMKAKGPMPKFATLFKKGRWFMEKFRMDRASHQEKEYRPLYGAPSLIMVSTAPACTLGEDECGPWPHQDASYAVAHLQIAAAGLGLSTCELSMMAVEWNK